MDFFGIGPMELVIVLVLALIVFGPRRLPEIGRGVGKAVHGFRKAMSDMTSELTTAADDVSRQTRAALQPPEDLPPHPLEEEKKAGKDE